MNKCPGSTIPLLKIKVEEKGRIKDIKEIIARVSGLLSCLNGQIVDMGDGVKGIIMGYDEEEVLVMVMGDESKLRMGKEISGVSEPFKVPVGGGYLGRIVDALAQPIDGGAPIEPEDRVPVFSQSAPITHRAPVYEFLPTGTKIIDILVPIARGQRQLILGDRMTGKTVLALDAILNQRGGDTLCVYCCIGKSVSALEKGAGILKKAGAMDYTVVMAATDNAPVGEQYIAPFSAASMAEHFASKGRHVLVVFDDLTKHAWAYRQLSLLLERPPGREAYPGDIFYVQTQLMERAGNFNEQHGGGSITFIGIAETLEGDLTGYIPSNLASMSDGQICMSTSLFAEGFRPAIDFSLSVSIIGGRVQPPILKTLSANLRAQYAQYVEVVKLSKLQSGATGRAARTVRRGAAIVSILQQGQYQPVSLAEEVLVLYALQKDMLDDLTPDQLKQFRETILAFARERNPALLDMVEEKRQLTPEIDGGLDRLAREFFAQLKGG